MFTRSFYSVICFYMFLLFQSSLTAQDNISDPDSLKSLAPNVYIDCSGCDNDYLRTEIASSIS